MSLRPGDPPPDPRRPLTAAGEVREATRRGTEALPATFGVVFATLLAAAAVGAFIMLDYQFGQDPHRILKVAIGLVGLGAIVAAPMFGLMVLPVVTPFLPWVPPTPVPGLNALNILLFTIFGTFALARVMSKQRVFRGGRLGAALGALLAVCAISIVRGAAFPTGYSYNPGDTTLQLFRSATTFAGYFIVLAMVDGLPARRRVGWAITLGLLAEALVTIAYGRNGSGGRALGSLGQSNELGTFLAMFAVGAVALVPATRSWLGKLVLVGAFVAGTVGVLMSVSRGGMIALGVGIAVVAWRTSKVLAFVIALALALSPLWAPQYVKDRISGSQVGVEGTDEVAMDSAAEARVETWRTILEVVQTHPLDGVGFAGLVYVLPDLGSQLGLEEVKDSAHNTYLRMLAEMGVLGLLLFLWLLWKVWRLADEGVRKARNPVDRGLAVALCGAFAALAVSCAFGDRFFNVVISSNFWILCALVESSLVERAPVPAPVELVPVPDPGLGAPRSRPWQARA